jgi:hypothetical protein
MKFFTHFVFFLFKPEKYKIEMSQDNFMWVTAMEYKEPPPVFLRI